MKFKGGGGVYFTQTYLRILNNPWQLINIKMKNVTYRAQIISSNIKRQTKFHYSLFDEMNILI